MKAGIWIMLLLLVFSGRCFAQLNNYSGEETEFTSEPITFSNGVILNILDGYVAVNQYNTKVLIKNLGLAAKDNESIVAVMVPEVLAMVPDQPYLVVIYYDGLVMNPKELANYSSEAMQDELILNKSTNPNMNWFYSSWIDSSARFDESNYILRLNCKFRNKYNQNVRQRQIAYWQFCNKGTYHYVWICPEEKLKIYGAPVEELDQLLVINRSNEYDINISESSCDQSTTLSELISKEDLGSQTLNTNGSNPELEKEEEQYEEKEEEERAPVVSSNLLVMFIANLSTWQLVLIVVVPAFCIGMLLLYNSSVFEPKAKEVNWEEKDEPWV